MITQKHIANILRISPPLLSMILKGHRRLSWTNAKKLSELIPEHSPSFFMDAAPEDLKKAFELLKNEAA